VPESGDAEAWRRLVELTTPLLFSWAHLARLQAADAADLVQELLTVLAQRLPTFDYDREKSFRGWLRTVTLNKYREQRRRRAAAPATEPDDRLDHVECPPESEQFWQREFHEQLVARALEIMRSEFRETTWRACWEAVVSGRSAADIAAELGITEVAVWSAKSKVLRRLREELEGLMD
jgi:RNA polymerase sigma-70 factor (ECF subfamily)